MSDKDIRNKLTNTYKALALLNLYRTELIISHGKKRFQEETDRLLDDLIYYKRQLKKRQDEKKETKSGRTGSVNGNGNKSGD